MAPPSSLLIFIIYLSKGDIEVHQGQSHPLAEFHHSEMMLQARRYFDGNESLALYVVVVVFVYVNQTCAGSYIKGG